MCSLEAHADEPAQFQRKDRKVPAGEMGSQEMICPTAAETSRCVLQKQGLGSLPPPNTDAGGRCTTPAGCTNEQLSGDQHTQSPGSKTTTGPTPVGPHRMLAPKSHQPKATTQGLATQHPYHHPSPQVLLPAVAGGGLGKPPPLGTPACGPGPQGQRFGACFGRGQPLPSQAASRAGSQGRKTLSSLAEMHTRGGGGA